VSQIEADRALIDDLQKAINQTQLAPAGTSDFATYVGIALAKLGAIADGLACRLRNLESLADTSPPIPNPPLASLPPYWWTRPGGGSTVMGDNLSGSHAKLNDLGEPHVTIPVPKEKKPLPFPVRMGGNLLYCPLDDDGTIHVSLDQVAMSFNLVDLLRGEIGITQEEAEKALQRWKDKHS
jgi:hypothetical protein